MFMSKRTWTRELENDIREVCSFVLDRQGRFSALDGNCNESIDKFNNWIKTLVKWGTQHITMLRYIDFSITVEGLHRGGTDDWDSHAMRFNNRIIRSSTRLAAFTDEMSEWYKGKIIPTDTALGILGIFPPDEFDMGGITYVRTTNGYIDKAVADDNDVKRGLYMLSIPSNFIFKVNLTEWAHVYKERNANSGANPEVKQCCEMIADQIEKFQPLFTRELFDKIKN
jgi:hypothetical protein